MPKNAESFISDSFCDIFLHSLANLDMVFLSANLPGLLTRRGDLWGVRVVPRGGTWRRGVEQPIGPAAGANSGAGTIRGGGGGDLGGGGNRGGGWLTTTCGTSGGGGCIGSSGAGPKGGTTRLRAISMFLADSKLALCLPALLHFFFLLAIAQHLYKYLFTNRYIFIYCLTTPLYTTDATDDVASPPRFTELMSCGAKANDP